MSKKKKKKKPTTKKATEKYKTLWNTTMYRVQNKLLKTTKEFKTL